ncbi:MAG: bifunctional pyr operon transcriptional regulator/uracil phosphoribosyltransferase PyrR [Acutalibacteraceae bacterium]
MSSVLMDELGMTRALMRISHEIVEKNESTDNLCIIGIKRRGIELAKIISANLEKLGATAKTGTLDIALYRDDITSLSPDARVNSTQIDFDINGKIVILVDDVIFTGRTCRAALDAVLSIGRPKKIQLAVLIDRGHRELPIRPDYVGKNIPTARNEIVMVCIPPYENESCVRLLKERD